MPVKYRGAMIRPYITLEDLQALLELGANVVRYELTDVAAGLYDEDGYRVWVRGHLDHLDTLIPLIAAHNAKVIIDLHTPPGGVDTSGAKPIARMFKDKPWARQCIQTVWAEIALRYKHAPTVLAFDLMNEPAGTSLQVYNLMTNLVEVIRLVNHEKPCIVSAPFSDPKNPLKVVPGRHIWYTIHFYSPLPMTHQGIYEFPAPRVYPNGNVHKARMIRDFEPVVAFQKKHKVPVYVGEYAISEHAPADSRKRWYTDITGLLEKYGFNNTFHAWREHPVWSIEVHPEVLDVFKKYWAKNG